MIVGSVAVLLVGFESPPPDTTTVFITVPGAAPAPTLVVTVIGWVARIRGERVGLECRSALLDAGPAGAREPRNRQARRRRLGHGHRPLDGALPTFLTVTVYVTVSPGMTMLGLCVFAIVRSLPDTGEVMTVGSVAVLLPGFGSPPPDTTAVFVTVPGATLAPTLVVTVISG